MNPHQIKTLDLHFLNKKQAIASYLIPWDDQAILIECGPTTTLPTLKTQLNSHGFSMSRISDLFVTHIHLDHAGAAGWLAKNGTRIHVHPNGAPHLIDPGALLTSAKRIYGDSMETLWGDVVPIPKSLVLPIEDGETIHIGPHSIQAISTPGHASHHHVYLYEGVCFTGDVGGVRVPGDPNLTLPMPPPEFHLELWRNSLDKLHSLEIDTIAPTHFGLYSDVHWHLDRIELFLREVDNWLESDMNPRSDLNETREQYTSWFIATAAAHGLTAGQLDLIEIINPSFMSGDGLHRYWNKYRMAETRE